MKKNKNTLEKPETWYRTTTLGEEILEVTVVGRTAAFITVERMKPGSAVAGEPTTERRSLQSGWERFFPRREEAVRWILDGLNGRISELERKLDVERKKLAKFLQEHYTPGV